MSIVFLALGPVGVSIGLSMLSYMRKPEVSKMEWWYEHMGAMLGAGIAFHTAFLVFGAQSLIDYAGVLGGLSWILWVLPAAIGVPPPVLWARPHRRKFAVLPAKAGGVVSWT